MFNDRHIITAIEIGTSKVTVLIGRAEADTLSVIGRGEADAAGAMFKGEITDMEQVFERLNEALDQADRSSGRELAQSEETVLVLTACDISSYPGVGTVFIKNEDQRVSDENIAEAIDNAQVISLPPDRALINCFDSFFMLDGVRRVRNPLEQVANKLEAHVQVIHGNANRIENFRSLLRDAGLAENVKPIFCAMADVYGILTEDEQKNGVVMVDIGAGTTEYAMLHNLGVLATGSLTVGFDHLANDLSIGLKLPITMCRKMLVDGTLERHFKAGSGIVEVKNANGSTSRIPVASFERIVDLRMRELFELVKSRLPADDLFHKIGCGGVLTGGGALFERSSDIYREVFNFPVRVGAPYQPGGALTNLDNPRYSAVWGALKYGNEVIAIAEAQNRRGVLGSLSRGFGRMVDRMWSAVTNIKKSVKV